MDLPSSVFQMIKFYGLQVPTWFENVWLACFFIVLYLGICIRIAAIRAIRYESESFFFFFFFSMREEQVLARFWFMKFLSDRVLRQNCPKYDAVPSKQVYLSFFLFAKTKRLARYRPLSATLDQKFEFWPKENLRRDKYSNSPGFCLESHIK